MHDIGKTVGPFEAKRRIAVASATDRESYDIVRVTYGDKMKLIFVSVERKCD